jgi:hypothetical protein
MTIENNRIELSDKEKQIFTKQFKCGVLNQLYKEKLLTRDQLNQVLKAVNN